MTSRLKTDKRGRRLAASALLPRSSRGDDRLRPARQFDEARHDCDGAEIRQRDERDSDLPAVPKHAQPVDDDAAAGDRHQPCGAEAAEEARPAQDTALVQAVDRDPVVAAVEELARDAKTADVEPVRDRRARLVEDARTVGPELVKEEVTAAVAADARLERIRQEYLAPERHVIDVEPGRRAVFLGQVVGEIGDGKRPRGP